MMNFWRFFASCIFSEPRAAHFQTCIPNSHQGHIMRGSMVDIQSATAENRRGKEEKKKKKNKETTYKTKI